MSAPPPLARILTLSESLFATDGSVARVALPVPVDELFEYTIPAARAAAIRPGCRVRVRFGGRTLIGVVVERAERAGYAGRLRAIDAVIDEAPVLSSELLGVLREAARDVLCPVGLALAAALPSGSAPFFARGFALTPRGRAAAESGALRGTAVRALEALAGGPLASTALVRRVGRDAIAALAALARDGLVAPCEVEQGPRARVALERVASLAPTVDLAAARAALARAPRQLALFERLATGEEPASALPAAALRALVERGFARVHRRGVPRDVLGAPLEAPRSVELTSDQARALAPIEAAVRACAPSTFLLHGVTGSGKTEVYLRAVAAALDAGRRGARARARDRAHATRSSRGSAAASATRVAVLHSGLRPGERLEQWLRLRARRDADRGRRALGAVRADRETSALVVIDEEHDGAYKNEEGFRYHARDLARRARAARRLPGACSDRRRRRSRRDATRPIAASSRASCSRTGSMASRCPRSSSSTSRASAHPRRAGASSCSRAPLRAALARDARRGRADDPVPEPARLLDADPVLRLRSRRALRRTATSRSSTTRPSGTLHCHYCEHRRAPPERCPSCGAPDTALLGLGTERVEEEVPRAFPGARDRAARPRHRSAARRDRGRARALRERRSSTC